jgi:muramoyltetrapeptide carboxypeptidase
VPLSIPPPLAPGDLIVVASPSSPPSRDELWRGLAWLRARYRIRMLPGALERDGYLAGDDDRRRDELAGALVDDDVKAIVATRGGYGAVRIAGRVPWTALAQRPKWIVGFSDVTALHAMAWRAGIASIHAPNVTNLGTDTSVKTRAAWLASIERPGAPRAWRDLRVVRSGRATGPIVGGNLALVHALAAAGMLKIPIGSVLALEDVTEAPYRVDRMLTSLVLGGHLARVSAIVFGDFARCPPGSDGRTVEDVLDASTRALGIPVLANAPFGHARHNEAFVLGAVVCVENGGVHWTPGDDHVGHSSP